MENKDLELIEKEIKGCFDFFWNESNTKQDDLIGYGLTLDKTKGKICSTAAVGFAFPAYVIGVEHGYVTYEEAQKRTLLTLKTLQRLEKWHGLLPHFVDTSTAKNHKSEFSTIDTAISYTGAIVAAEYFGGEIKEIVYNLINDIDWKYYIQVREGKTQVNMAYNPYFWEETNHFCPATWDQYAEQMMMYFLIAGKKDITKEEAKALYHGFTRHHGTYQGFDVVHCFGNALFTHQFTHAFFRFQDYLDDEGFDWFENSKKATLCNRLYCLELKQFKTYNEDSWGLTAFQGKKHYHVFGAKPFGFQDKDLNQDIDGSVAPYAALSSIVFTPELSLRALRYFNTIEGLNGKYGLADSYNFDDYYISDQYLGIDKGPTIVMLDNYLKGTTWKYFMKSEFIQQAINKLDFKRKGE